MCTGCSNNEVPTGSQSSSNATSGEGGATSNSSSSSTGGGGGGAGGAGGNDVAPPKPPALTNYVTGNDADANVTPQGPGLILMGGGSDVDDVFHWAKQKMAGGDIVVLRTSGADGYNDYLYKDIGQVDSVETLLVTTKELANDPYVIWKIRHAESIFLAGGDQATYLTAWKDQGVEIALGDAWARGAVIGGTSAGCAVLGEFMFAAYNDTVYSEEALLDPYNMYMTMERGFLSFPPLASTITDSHFAARDRMGRLATFLGRLITDGWADVANVRGLGIDEQTALVIENDGMGTVMGTGAVYVVEATKAPSICQSGVPLEFSDLTYRKLIAGDKITLPAGDSAVPASSLSAGNGGLVPVNPY
jgi:cyanophycinase